MLYDRSYFEATRAPAESSAGVIVPLVTGLIGPRSVLDVGCGDGTWLDAYRRAGVGDYFGVDAGDVRDALRVPPERFAHRDLTRPLDLGRRFDLVQALGVAEHLPAGAAGEFVRTLVRHGDAVLFAAAIPHQGGPGHVNEQWPDYWAGLFRAHGFGAYDWVRPRVWGDDRVAWWYAQNALLFVRDGAPVPWARHLPAPAPVGPLLCLVHPGRHLAARAPDPRPGVARTLGPGPGSPYDAAVVIPTLGRPSLERAVRSVYAQEFPGTIQVLIGVDAWTGGLSRAALDALVAAAPGHVAVTVLDPGYSTSARHGGVHPARDGGALRTVLSYLAHSRRVAYLDDDNWWAPDHLAALAAALTGRPWAFTLRWYVDPAPGAVPCPDRWESVGPDAGCYRDRFGGWVDPNCLMLDKGACEPALRLWSVPLPGDGTQLTGDRHVFSDLRLRGPAGATGRATVYYALTPADVMYPRRREWIAEAQAQVRAAPGGGGPGGFTQDWFTHNLPVWERLLAPLAGRPVRALEVGVFEGRSAVWLLERVLTHPGSSLTWVDTFGGGAEHARLDLSGLEARFRANVARFGPKVTGHVGRSQDVLRAMGAERFDLIYIDGSHEAPDVLADAVLAWPLLAPGGLLGFDDYAWRDFPDPERCPAVAVDGFLAAMRGRYRELHRGYQVWVQKVP